MYESPIEVIYGELQTAWEDSILGAVWKYDIHCNKEELTKALAYDRDQYRKGYRDGWEEGREALRREIWEDGRDRCD